MSKLKKRCSQCVAVDGVCDRHATDALAAVTRERDAAICKCIEIAERLAAVTMELETCRGMLNRLVGGEEARDLMEASAMVERNAVRRAKQAEAERDEAIADVVRTRDERDLWGSRAMKAEAERDELRRFVGAAAQERDEARARIRVLEAACAALATDKETNND